MHEEYYVQSDSASHFEAWRKQGSDTGASRESVSVSPVPVQGDSGVHLYTYGNFDGKKEEIQSIQNELGEQSDEQSSQEGKYKSIKKNRESAQESRRRKKTYIAGMQKQKEQLIKLIEGRKANIEDKTGQILAKMGYLSFQKSKYLKQKLQLSRKLINTCSKLEKTKTQVGLIDKNKDSDQRNGLIQSIAKRSRVKKQGLIAQQMRIQQLRDSMSIQQNLLNLEIDGYKYKFGMNGYQLNNLIESAKFEWINEVISTVKPQSTQLMPALAQMKTCFDKLQTKQKRLGHWMRQIKKRVKDRFIVQLLLNRQFFMHDKAQTIFKNTQILAQCQNDS